MNLLATYCFNCSMSDNLIGLLFFIVDLLLLAICIFIGSLSFRLDAFLSLDLLKFLIDDKRSPLDDPALDLAGSFLLKSGGPEGGGGPGGGGGAPVQTPVRLIGGGPGGGGGGFA